MAPNQGQISNRMLTALDLHDFALLAPYLERVDLPAQFQIAKPRERLEHVYFPESGIGAVMTVSSTGQIAEAGMFGWEGFVPTATIIGDNVVPYIVEMNIAGWGYRVPIEAMRQATMESSSFQVPLIKYMHVFATQVAFTALANIRYLLEQRLARWILMCHDRLRSDEMCITHEYIALMLGARRPGVTTALHILEGHRLIRSLRGSVVIRDREGLEAFAAGSYGVPEQEFERLIGSRAISHKPA
ncbi:CRP-like cAMP-binding protein [Rhizobium sp. BK529]|uniref:Crp/Fnr family transcriptional regulator n=1 Tax=Rhizobium sp. BK529 TaxID=2586983 RepID=UPI00161B47A1|nr:Crp/Fnr family transcriptional regulator [Rhizobium sp. BK529]MBB3594803.1 CRP-like cAMP-binding protein [Rhizobium sp. BK529]